MRLIINHITSFINKQIEKAGYLGIGSIILAWIDIICAFIFAFCGDETKAIMYVLWAGIGVAWYYISRYQRGN